MKIQDMVLVIENTKGSEKNMLMTLKEYKEEYLFVVSLSREQSAELLKELSDTRFSKASWFPSQRKKGIPFPCVRHEERSEGLEDKRNGS